MSSRNLDACVVLASHGSRGRRVQDLLSTIATGLKRESGVGQVLLAFHQGTPTFAEVLGLVSLRRALVVPFFMAEGYYTRQVLRPGLLQHPAARELDVQITPALGSHPGMRSLLAQRCRTLLGRRAWDPATTAALVLGHGTPRSSSSGLTASAAAAELQQQQVCASVVAAFMAEPPSPQEAVAELDVRRVVVLPFLIGGGMHAAEVAELCGVEAQTSVREDGIVGRDESGRSYHIDRPIGEDQGVSEIVHLLVQQKAAWTRLEPPGRLSHAE